MGKFASRPDDCMNPSIVKYTVTRSKYNPTGQILPAAGDHRKAVGVHPKTQEKSTMTFCDRPMGKGLACKIWKWLKYMGFVLIPLALIFLNQVLTSHPELLSELK